MLWAGFGGVKQLSKERTKHGVEWMKMPGERHGMGAELSGIKSIPVASLAKCRLLDPPWAKSKTSQQPTGSLLKTSALPR
jgi:hypothetical protein